MTSDTEIQMLRIVGGMIIGTIIGTTLGILMLNSKYFYWLFWILDNTVGRFLDLLDYILDRLEYR